MAEGQNITLIISPGHSAQSTQRHIALHQRRANGAARLQHLFALLRRAARTHSRQAKGSNFFLQILQTVLRKAACHQRSALRQPVRRDASLLIQKRQHSADRRQKTIMRVIERLAKGHRADEPAVHINRTAAHALRHAASFVNEVTIKTRKNIIARRLRAAHAQNLHIKFFNCIAADNRLANTLHTRLDITHRHQRNISRSHQRQLQAQQHRKQKYSHINSLNIAKPASQRSTPVYNLSLTNFCYNLLRSNLIARLYHDLGNLAASRCSCGRNAAASQRFNLYKHIALLYLRTNLHQTISSNLAADHRLLFRHRSAANRVHAAQTKRS